MRTCIHRYTWVFLPVREFDLDAKVPGDLLDPGSFGAHNGAVELLWDGAFDCHLSFLWESRVALLQCSLFHTRKQDACAW